MKVGTVFYLCDRKACGEACPNEECTHTRRVEHALHKDADPEEFMLIPSCKPDCVDLWEPDGECV